MKTFLTAVVLSLLLVHGEQATAQANQESVSILWKGIGGKTRWDNTNYILFTATGNESKHLQNGRKFLINKQSGQVRFEGKVDNGDNIVALFNFKTQKILRLFSNGVESKTATEEVNEYFAKIHEQFKKDATFLFLPTLIDKPETRTGKSVAKIVNAEKLQSVPFQLKDNSLAGEVLFNVETGYIKQLVDREGNEFYVNGYKDIGGGVFLPTTFKSMDSQNKSTSFTTVAAFTEMEDAKFSNL
ncbi:hypothetical protein PQ465_02315 [Sphingobacterium oryzagri]|uniref:Uncharacterized protein n=1 Tax=Sphingobacterium oryzagri TaxID=3025669 RepID=A0ABY7WHZ2_9SPHI|nr:hypothetical protein [Sphingobacterium sp. KACC 22765]WDF69226.1 hypothetical protein PQ465_02315 [Sphingobacterium sp. KACC 22765]